MFLAPILKAAFLGIILAAAAESRFAAATFVAAALIFYFRHFFDTRRFFYSFAVLSAVSLIAVKAFNGWSIGVGAASGILFFVLFGIKDLAFVKRREIYYFFNCFLLLAVFGLFFGADKQHFFIFKYLAASAAVFLLSAELLNLMLPALVGVKKNLVAGVFALSAVQFLWAVAFLPIGFANSAALMTVIVLFLEDFIVHHFSGTLNRRLILRNATAFLILILAIFAASEWTI